MPLRTIHLNEIPDEGLTVDTALEPQWLRESLAESGLEPRGDAPGRARLRLDRRERDVTLSGNVEAAFTAQCVRCLAPTEVDLRTEFTLNLEPMPAARRASSKQSEVELTSDEADVDYYENDRIDVAHWVREQILLEVPAHPSCEPACAEPIAAPVAPPDPTEKIDPRLLPLKKLANKE